GRLGLGPSGARRAGQLAPERAGSLGGTLSLSRRTTGQGSHILRALGRLGHGPSAAPSAGQPPPERAGSLAGTLSLSRRTTGQGSPILRALGRLGHGPSGAPRAGQPPPERHRSLAGALSLPRRTTGQRPPWRTPSLGPGQPHPARAGQRQLGRAGPPGSALLRALGSASWRAPARRAAPSCARRHAGPPGSALRRAQACRLAGASARAPVRPSALPSALQVLQALPPSAPSARVRGARRVRACVV